MVNQALTSYVPIQLFSLPPLMEAIRRWVLALSCALSCAGCASFPDAAQELDKPYAPAVKFDNARGPISTSKSAATVELLKQKSGDIDILQKHLEIEQAINVDSPLVLGNKLTLLQDGPATYKAMFAFMRKAKANINLETYIFADDDIGKQFVDLLLEKQAVGVQVNVIYDSVGSLGTPKEFFKRLTDAGIQVLEFNPINPLAIKKTEWLLNNRDHRKLLVVDGRTAFIGGINISESYSSGPSAKSTKKDGTSTTGWRDTHLQIEGPVVAEFQKLFMDTWNKQKGPPLVQGNYFPKLSEQGSAIVRAIGSTSAEPSSAIVRAIGSASAEPSSLIYLTLLSAIDNAEQQVHLTNAYFDPDPQLLKSLTDAAHRGVKVTLVLPSHTDSWAVFHAGRAHFSDLLEAGVMIYQRRGAVLHSKTVSIDSVWSTIGSSNLDWRSFLHNNEINAAILDRNFTQQMDTMFAQDLAQSDVIDVEAWDNRSLLTRLKELAARLVEYWL